MDVIKVVGIYPRILSIIYFETEIGRNVSRLDWREIRADNDSRGELLGEFDGPDSGSGCDVEDIVEAAFEVIEGC